MANGQQTDAAAGILSGALKAGAGGGIPSISSSSSAASGPISNGTSFDGSGWVVNFGDGSAAGSPAGIPIYVWLIGGLVLLAWLKRK